MRSSQILLAAAAACNFASFAGSMGGLGLGGGRDLRTKSCCRCRRWRRMQIRFRNKHMYTCTSFRSQPPSFTFTQMSAIFHIRPADPKDVVCIIYTDLYIYIFWNFLGGQDIILQLIIGLVRSYFILSIERLTSLAGDIWERARISQGYSRTCLCQLTYIWIPSSFEYRRI
jgi:hypothetical protein